MVAADPQRRHHQPPRSDSLSGRCAGLYKEHDTVAAEATCCHTRDGTFFKIFYDGQLSQQYTDKVHLILPSRYTFFTARVLWLIAFCGMISPLSAQEHSYVHYDM